MRSIKSAELRGKRLTSADYSEDYGKRTKNGGDYGKDYDEDY